MSDAGEVVTVVHEPLRSAATANDPVRPSSPDRAAAAFGDKTGLTLRHVVPVNVNLTEVDVKYIAEPPWTRMIDFLRLSSTSEPSLKSILTGVSANMPAGSLTAILGSSGSGKTTLLNTVAHRISSQRLKVSGSVTYNDDPNMHSVRSAYVMQQDVLLPTLTVRETLQYAAGLRLASPSLEAERNAIVESIILELGLKECADTRIGSSLHKGCSGGEKRRCSIGVQLLANPSVLYCDEPTTGKYSDVFSSPAVRPIERLP